MSGDRRATRIARSILIEQLEEDARTLDAQTAVGAMYMMPSDWRAIVRHVEEAADMLREVHQQEEEDMPKQV